MIATTSPATRVLLVEDDDGDAVLVAALLEDADEAFSIVRVATIGAAIEAVGRGVDCVLLDLGLPGLAGIEALDRLLAAEPDVPVVVLTGLLDHGRGIDAVAAGAQDYFVKGDVDGRALGRGIRYAVERGAAAATRRRLLLAERRQRENELLARGLAPSPLIGGAVALTSRYKPGGLDALLGGDFFDAVELEDGTVRLVIGDVCGHGPEAAALGVALRISWRALVLSGAPATTAVATLDAVFAAELQGEASFATMCDLEVAADRTELRVLLCGHPPPLLVHPEIRWLDELHPSRPIGLGPEVATQRVALPARWSLLLVTDGLFEGRTPAGGRLGTDGLHDLARAATEGGDAMEPGAFLDHLIEQAEARHGGPLPDDVALVRIDHDPRDA